ncbi:HslU--HslV peptidase ATPase subunit, partial [Streptococcus suis]
MGKEVDSIIRDLTDTAVKLMREQEMARLRHRAEDAAEDRILDALLPRAKRNWNDSEAPGNEDDQHATRQTFRKKLREGKLDDKEI